MSVILGYIDPGAGSLILQVVVAGIIGGAVYCRRAIANVWGKLTGRSGGKGDVASASPADKSAGTEKDLAQGDNNTE